MKNTMTTTILIMTTIHIIYYLSHIVLCCVMLYPIVLC